MNEHNEPYGPASSYDDIVWSPLYGRAAQQRSPTRIDDARGNMSSGVANPNSFIRPSEDLQVDGGFKPFDFSAFEGWFEPDPHESGLSQNGPTFDNFGSSGELPMDIANIHIDSVGSGFLTAPMQLDGPHYLPGQTSHHRPLAGAPAPVEFSAVESSLHMQTPVISNDFAEFGFSQSHQPSETVSSRAISPLFATKTWGNKHNNPQRNMLTLTGSEEKKRVAASRDNGSKKIPSQIGVPNKAKNQSGTVATLKLPREDPTPKPRRRARVSGEAKRILEKYFSHNTYPEGPEFDSLNQQTKLPVQQIKVWFNNKRHRTLSKDEKGDYAPITPQTSSFGDLLGQVEREDPRMLLERYLQIPLETDHAGLPVLADGVRSISRNSRYGHYSSHQGSSQSFSRAGSEVSGSSSAISSGNDSTYSSRSRASRVTKSSRQGRRRHIPAAKRTYTLEEQITKQFQCTFCKQSLKDFYEWRRHEEATHAPRSGWICTHSGCEVKPDNKKIFFREDLFRSHFKRVHETPDDPSQGWASAVTVIEANPIPADHPALLCGYCGEKLKDWDTRMEHVAAHYVTGNGSDMSQWWLRRVECNSTPPPRGTVKSSSDQKFGRSACYCIHCGEIYKDPANAAQAHRSCTVWSCGYLGGVRSAFEKSDGLLTMWRCRYCSFNFDDTREDWTERLRHLITEHQYRGCSLSKFVDVDSFGEHLHHEHNALNSSLLSSLAESCRGAVKPTFEEVPRQTRNIPFAIPVQVKLPTHHHHSTDSIDDHTNDHTDDDAAVTDAAEEQFALLLAVPLQKLHGLNLISHARARDFAGALNRWPDDIQIQLPIAESNVLGSPLVVHGIGDILLTWFVEPVGDSASASSASRFSTKFTVVEDLPADLIFGWQTILSLPYSCFQAAVPAPRRTAAAMASATASAVGGQVQSALQRWGPAAALMSRLSLIREEERMDVDEGPAAGMFGF